MELKHVAEGKEEAMEELTERIKEDFLPVELTATSEDLSETPIDEAYAKDIIMMLGRADEGEIKLGDIELKVNKCELPEKTKVELKHKLRDGENKTKTVWSWMIFCRRS
jgi:hypothetical protein